MTYKKNPPYINFQGNELIKLNDLFMIAFFCLSGFIQNIPGTLKNIFYIAEY